MIISSKLYALLPEQVYWNPYKNNTILSDNYLINSNQILGLVQFKIYMYVCMY